MLGFYFTYKYYGYTPSIKITWWKITIGENVYEKLRLDKYLTVIIIGFFAGLQLVLWDKYLIFTYLLINLFNFLAIGTILYYHFKGELMHYHTMKSLTERNKRMKLNNYLYKSD